MLLNLFLLAFVATSLGQTTAQETGNLDALIGDVFDNNKDKPRAGEGGDEKVKIKYLLVMFRFHYLFNSAM
jgi:hypothetical protein